MRANAPTLGEAIATPKFFPVIMVLLIPSQSHRKT